MARSGTNHVTSTGGRRDIVDDHPLVRDGSPGVFTGIRGFGWRRRDHRATPITRRTRPRPDPPYDTYRRRGAGEPPLVGAAYAAGWSSSCVSRPETPSGTPGPPSRVGPMMPPSACRRRRSTSTHSRRTSRPTAGRRRTSSANLRRAGPDRPRTVRRQHRVLDGGGQPVRPAGWQCRASRDVWPLHSKLEDDAGEDAAGEHVVDGLVDLVELVVDGDDPGAAGGVQGEDVGKVVAGADDRANNRLAVEDRVEDRARHRAVGGQRD